MKKMLLGIIFLLLIFCLCLGNTVYLDIRLSDITTKLQQSIQGDEIANESLFAAYKAYLSVENYTDMVLRETKCEKLSEMFLDALSVPGDPIKIRRIIWELDNIRNADRISWGSIM